MARRAFKVCSQELQTAAAALVIMGGAEQLRHTMWRRMIQAAASRLVFPVTREPVARISYASQTIRVDPVLPTGSRANPPAIVAPGIALAAFAAPLVARKRHRAPITALVCSRPISACTPPEGAQPATTSRTTVVVTTQHRSSSMLLAK